MYIYILLLIILLIIILFIKCFCMDKFYNIKDTVYKTYYINKFGIAQSCNKKLITLFKFCSFPDNIPLTPSWERIKVPSIEFFLNSLIIAISFENLSYNLKKNIFKLSILCLLKNFQQNKLFFLLYLKLYFSQYFHFLWY